MKKVLITIMALLIFDIFIWGQIAFGKPTSAAKIYALDVGQGDSELVALPYGVKILIDGGPNGKVMDKLNSILSPLDRRIDLIILSHPDTDHFSGLINVFKKYSVGAFIYNGEIGKAESFLDLEKSIKEGNVPVVVLSEGDSIKYENNDFKFLSPPAGTLESDGTNSNALVFELSNPDFKALFTGDIDSKIEKKLIEKYDLSVDILKVAHHGSKTSTSKEFLKAVKPKVSLIEVGAGNSYGHPTSQVLDNLKEIGSKIFRTDLSGTIGLEIKDNKISILSER